MTTLSLPSSLRSMSAIASASADAKVTDKTLKTGAVAVLASVDTKTCSPSDTQTVTVLQPYQQSTSASWKNISRMSPLPDSSPCVGYDGSPVVSKALLSSSSSFSSSSYNGVGNINGHPVTVPTNAGPFLSEPLMSSPAPTLTTTSTSPMQIPSQNSTAPTTTSQSLMTPAAAAAATATNDNSNLFMVAQSIERIALRDSKQNLRFIPILSSAEATKQGELNLIVNVEKLKTPSYVLEASKRGYFFICSRSGKCVTVKDKLSLLICKTYHASVDTDSSGTSGNSFNTSCCNSNDICKYVCFSPTLTD